MAGKTYQLKSSGLYKFVANNNGNKLAFIGGSSFPLTIDCHDSMNVMGRTTISGSGFSGGCRLEIDDNDVIVLVVFTGTRGFDSDQVNIRYDDSYMMSIGHRGHFKNIGNDWRWYCGASYGTGSGDSAEGNLRMQLNQLNGDLHCGGDVIAYSTTVSDIRLKKNIRPITASLETLCKLYGIKYDWKYRKDDS